MAPPLVFKHLEEKMHTTKIAKIAKIAKSTSFLLLFILLFSADLLAISGDYLDFHGYLRSGISTNNKGGDMGCNSITGAYIGNPGSQALNEFRLGNECTDYSELTFTAHNLKAKTKSDQEWRTQFLFRYQPDGHESSEEDEVAMRESFVEGKNIFGKQFTYWVGKRFYRDVNSNINDWYYFADMSGNGAGVANIDTGFGKLSLATIHHTSGSEDTDIGKPKKIVYDLRLFDIPINKSANLNFWAAYATAANSYDAPNYYAKTNGTALGLRYRQNMLGGFNDFTILWGDKLLTRTDLYGDNTTTIDDNQNHSNKILFVDDMTAKITDNLEFHLALIYEKRDTGRATKPKQTWKSIGVRPVYFFSDRFSLATEMGQSIVENEVESRERKLSKITISGQLHPNIGIWTRPVLRAYITSFKWNSFNNEDNSSSGGLWAIQSTPPYAEAKSAFMFGFQAEVWF